MAHPHPTPVASTSVRPPEPAAAPLLHDLTTAAAMLGIGRTTLFDLLARGELASVSIGRRRLVPTQALADYVDHLVAPEGGGSR